MMKNILNKILFVFSASFLLLSCNDDFLERQPLDQISNSSFWNTENDLAVYNNYYYHLVQNDNDYPILMGHDDGFDSQKYSYAYLDGMSDNTAPRHGRGLGFANVRSGLWNAPSSKDANDAGGWFGYKGWPLVRAINIGLAQYDKANVPESAKNHYKAEARLFRAIFYADKVSKYGDVQWADKELTTTDDDILYGKRDSRDLVMGKVLEDLNFAVANLRSSNPGKLTLAAAQLLKSRVCLFEGTWRKYHNLGGHEQWLTEAASAAKALMDSGAHSLHVASDPNFSYNELHRLEVVDGSPEPIFIQRYERGIRTNHFQNYYRQYNGGATKSFVEDFLCEDGLPISLSPLYQGDANFRDLFVNRDPRLRQSVLHPDDQVLYTYGNHGPDVNPYPRLQGMSGGMRIYTGYHIIKNFQVAPAYAGYNSSMTPGIPLRFGEALLNYAEAKAELGGGTISQADLDISINLLRDRVGMPHLTPNPPMDPRYADEGISSILVEIRRERRIELFIEGFRYDDLRRWKQGKKLEQKDYGIRWDAANKAAIDPDGRTIVKSGLVDGVEYLEIYKGTDFENPVFDESKHYLWPLPLDVLSQNPDLGQNPGW